MPTGTGAGTVVAEEGDSDMAKKSDKHTQHDAEVQASPGAAPLDHRDIILPKRLATWSQTCHCTTSLHRSSR